MNLDRTAGPVSKDHGLNPVSPDCIQDKQIMRVCNCCSILLKKTQWFSYNGPRREYSFTCRSCNSWLTLFSQQLAKDEDERPKRKRNTKRIVEILEPVPSVTISQPTPIFGIGTRWQTKFYNPQPRKGES